MPKDMKDELRVFTEAVNISLDILHQDVLEVQRLLEEISEAARVSLVVHDPGDTGPK